VQWLPTSGVDPHSATPSYDSSSVCRAADNTWYIRSDERPLQGQRADQIAVNHSGPLLFAFVCTVERCRTCNSRVVDRQLLRTVQKCSPNSRVSLLTDSARRAPHLHTSKFDWSHDFRLVCFPFYLTRRRLFVLASTFPSLLLLLLLLQSRSRSVRPRPPSALC
jgi:hypothetical protein